MKNEVLWVAKYDYPEGYGIKPHAHDYYQIMCITAGGCTFHVAQETVTLQKDIWVLLKPGVEHSMDKITEGTLKMLDIKFVIHEKKLQEKVNLLPLLLTSEDQYAPFLVERIRKEGKQKQEFFKEMTGMLLSELLVNLVRAYLPGEGRAKQAMLEPDSDSSPLLKRITDYIHKNYASKIYLETLADHLGYNKNYLCQKFKKELGITIADYIQNYRIQKAKELIVYSDYDLKQICEKVGFENIYHFSRVFKEQEGVPPGVYKKREKEELGKDIIIKENFINPDKIDKS